jgi:hypothetical protein
VCSRVRCCTRVKLSRRDELPLACVAVQRDAEERDAAERASREERARLEAEENRRREAEERKRHANGDGNQASKQQKMDKLFAVGDTVHHDQHGLGKVVQGKGDGRISVQYKSGTRSYDPEGAQLRLKRFDSRVD